MLYEVITDRAERMAQEIKLFKRDQGVVDYTDMIEQFVQFGTCPRFELLIVDEAQDLSRLQWEMVEKLAEGVPNVYFAGDDDQAIYEWAGADLNYFLNIDGEKIVLKKSYRLRKSVFDLCQHIVSAVNPRYPKEQQYLEEGVITSYSIHYTKLYET